MRYIMKGGVWKNSEDQILKAAIMKYGLNQWSRISSLLQRKSAKQCKQRWYEWLDPSIKKTEWTRAEDEKLLQLSRVFPSQWRTIAPFVGRTPTQCYERYEKLLDVAQGKSIKEAQDLKKLRPGEIDPNPETKPARLDPIDMDQDQKEMLAEVRVRLANTKGKKAKRKEREKIIEEARRLAQLQKVRQLEMAGVQNIPTAKQIKRMRQRKDIDYNKEIPFKRDVPQFVYRAEESQTPKNTSFASTITLQTLQGKRRDVEEELQRKLDKRRMKKFRERDLKAMLQLKGDFQKPTYVPIKLPEPQIGQKDLELMKKFNISTPLNSQMQSSINTPFQMTPQNKILFSARVNFSLNHEASVGPSQDDEYGIRGLQKLKNMQKQPLNQQMRSIDRVISERMATPARGNQWEQQKQKVKNLFKGLSKPENIIQFEIPQEQEEQEAQEIMDAEQRERLQLIEMQKAEQEKRKSMTQVLKRGLNRPNRIPNTLKLQSTDEVSKLIEQEMLSLIYSDAIDYPLKQASFPAQAPPYRSEIDSNSILEARSLVQEEMKNQNDEFNEELYQNGRKRVKLEFNKKQAKVQSKAVNRQDSVEYEKYKINLQFYKQHIKKTESNQKKAKKLLAGYEKLIKNKVSALNASARELEALQTEKSIVQSLLLRERISAATRLSQLEQYYKLIYNAI